MRKIGATQCANNCDHFLLLKLGIWWQCHLFINIAILQGEDETLGEVRCLLCFTHFFKV
jgi:hypothetical protein